MDRPTVTVVGLGPAGAEFMTVGARVQLTNATVARLRTRRHPAAGAFVDVISYDHLYEGAESFEALYVAIVDDLVALALTSPDFHVVYAVPGSPLVGERTVELLTQRGDVELRLEPAVSVIDVACAAVGRDPMTVGLRVVDALASSEPFVGPGPLLVLQTYSSEILAMLADRLTPDTPVSILHHLGLADQRIEQHTARTLSKFAEVDHLTSVWVDQLRTPGVVLEEMVNLTRVLRERCPWDQEQTHDSLQRHLLEEAYEAIDALERYVVATEASSSEAVDSSEVVEELGDLLFQILFHAELGREQDEFNFIDIVDALRVKLIGRHPHVFGDVRVESADEVANRWEAIKRVEKQRASVTEGIPMQLPALMLYAKLRRKAMSIGVELEVGELARARALMMLTSLHVLDQPVNDAVVDGDLSLAWGELLAALSDLARWCGVDLEATLRQRAISLRSEIMTYESEKSSKSVG